MAELVRVKDKFQVTLPLTVRSAAAIRAGDYLEVSAVAEGILLRPHRMVSPAPSVRSILEFLNESHGPGRSQAQIDAELAAQRDQW